MQFTLGIAIASLLNSATGQIIRGVGNEWPLRCGHPQNDPKNHVSNLFDSLITRMTANKTEMAFELINPGATATHITMCNDGDCSMMQGAFDEELIEFFTNSKIEIFSKTVATLPNGSYQVNCEAIFIQELIVYAMKMSAVWVHGDSEDCGDYVLTNMSLKDMRCEEGVPIYTSTCPYSTAFAGGASTVLSTFSTTSITTSTTTTTIPSTSIIVMPMPTMVTVTSPIPVISTITVSTSTFTSTTTYWITVTATIA